MIYNMVSVLYHDYSYLNELFDEINKENCSNCLSISKSIYKNNQEKLKELIVLCDIQKCIMHF